MAATGSGQGSSATALNAKVVKALCEWRGRPFVTLNDVGKRIGVPVLAFRSDILPSLRTNPRIAFDEGGKLKYSAKVDLLNESELLRWLSRHPEGALQPELEDSYPGVVADIDRLVHEGRIIKVKSIQTTVPPTLFPRTDPLLIKLSGVAVGTAGQAALRTSEDLTHQLFRGDVLVIADKRYRVRYTMKNGRKEEMASVALGPRATGGAFTAAHSEPHIFHKRDFRWFNDFTSTSLPLDRPFEGPFDVEVELHKVGGTRSLRELWKQTRVNSKGFFHARAPTNHGMLRKAMQAAGLAGMSKLTNSALTKGTLIRQTKKRSVRRTKSTTFAESASGQHLQGTAIGRAIELQRIKQLEQEQSAKVQQLREEDARRAAEYRAKKRRQDGHDE